MGVNWVSIVDKEWHASGLLSSSHCLYYTNAYVADLQAIPVPVNLPEPQINQNQFS